MADEPTGSGGERDEREAPRAIVRTRSMPSIVWLIPFVAALVGLYLAYWAWSEQGPTIQVYFESADGLIAGQTRLKFKQVDVGLVESEADGKIVFRDAAKDFQAITIDATKVTNYLLRVSDLKVGRVMTYQPESLAAFGLDKPAYELSVEVEGAMCDV